MIMTVAHQTELKHEFNAHLTTSKLYSNLGRDLAIACGLLCSYTPIVTESLEYMAQNEL